MQHQGTVSVPDIVASQQYTQIFTLNFSYTDQVFALSFPYGIFCSLT